MLCTGLILQAQGPTYFQQQADYDMEVELLPQDHLVRGVVKLTYHNRSPQTLDSLALHLWANAYASRDSPFGQQKRRLGSVRFAFAPDDQLGGYRDFKFTGNSITALRYETPEIAWVKLAQPLQSGDSTTLSYTFTLRIPSSFSRLGRVAQSYQLTQWYPKVALYDHDGWHTMPYLDFGEYFNDFGNYDVRITVPANGLVAATGDLMNADAVQLRRQRIELTQTDTASIDSLQFDATASRHTFHYRAENVTDFAWFVNPKFRVTEDSAITPRGRIPTFAYYTAKRADLWRSGASLLARAVSFGDSLVGAYPHNQMTAVSAPLGVGGGMEYPGITVIGAVSSLYELDRVLAHEAYHNWFQGHVASNERTQAWMDEGMTSWLEQRYTQHYYDDVDLASELGLPKFLSAGSPYNEDNILTAFLGPAKRNPPPAIHSDSVSGIQYGYAAYSAPARLFSMLEASLPTGDFERRVGAYYSNWGGRHPQPKDLLEALGQGQVAWLRALTTQAALPNYALADVVAAEDSVRVTVANKSKIASPFPIAFEREDGTYSPDVWLSGFGDTTGLTESRKTFTLALPQDARRIAIDPHAKTPEVKRGDNYYRLSAGPLPRLEPMTVNLLSHLGHPGRTDLNLVPVLGYTSADRFMLGLGMHNYTADVGGTRFYLLPEVSFRDASLNGFAGIKHSVYARNAWWREFEVSATGRQFHYNYNDNYDYNDRFHRGTLAATLYFDNDYNSLSRNELTARGHFVAQRYAVGRDITTRSFTEETNGYSIYELSFTHRNTDPIRPRVWSIDAQAGKGFTRVSTTFNLGLRYQQAARFVRIRGFAGTFLNHDNPDVNALLLPAGITGFLNRQYDYTYEQFLINRSRSSESNQHFVRDGSLSIPYVLPVPGSNQWLASVSVVADAPLSLPIVKLQAYLDAALYPDSRLRNDGVLVPVTGGVRIALGPIASVSLPLYNSSFVKEATVFTRVDARYRDRITFNLDFSSASIDRLLRAAK